MQLREYAESILLATSLEEKLARPPEDWVDSEPGPAQRINKPSRPPALAIQPARAVKVPPIAGMQDLSQRKRILHALANHELQAAELFAWMILAFPDEPPAFRRGLLAILVEEQEHCELYLDRLRHFGGEFGDYGVTGHFWNHIDSVKSKIDFLCLMGLTFENANLDFAQDYAKAAREVGDEETAKALDIVHEDEIRHVAFSWRWLQKWKPENKSGWQVFVETLEFPMGPFRARGKEMDVQARLRAGLDSEFIEGLKEARALRPNGRER